MSSLTLVTMTHPDLPGQEIRVPTSSVGFHVGSGWQPVDGKYKPESEESDEEKKAETEAVEAKDEKAKAAASRNTPAKES